MCQMASWVTTCVVCGGDCWFYTSESCDSAAACSCGALTVQDVEDELWEGRWVAVIGDSADRGDIAPGFAFRVEEALDDRVFLRGVELPVPLQQIRLLAP